MIYFIYGDSEREQEAEKVVESIKKANNGISEKQFDFSQKEAESFLESVRQTSMFVSKELIVGKRAEQLKNIGEIIEILAMYNTDSKEIVIVYDDSDSTLNKKIITAAGKIAKVTDARKENKKKELLQYIKDNTGFSDKDAFQFMEMAGDEFLRLKNEIDKLKNYFAGKTMSLEEAAGIITKSKEYKIYEVTAALLAGNKKEVYEYLAHTGNNMLFLYSLAKELQTILKIKFIMEEKSIVFTPNYNLFVRDVQPEIKTEFFGHPFALFKRFESAAKFQSEFIEKKLKELFQAELRIKNGAMDEDSSMVMFVAKF